VHRVARFVAHCRQDLTPDLFSGETRHEVSQDDHRSNHDDML
jgi:hypothetical protein